MPTTSRNPVRPPARRVAGQRRTVEQHHDRVSRPAPAAPAPARRAPASRRRWLLVVLAVLAAASVTAASWLVALDAQQAGVDRARTQALQAARADAELVLGYDHRRLDQDFAAALAVSTGDFATQYRRTTESAVRALATDTQAVVTAKVAAAGVVEASADRVVVLLFVNQTTTSNRLTAPETDQTRVQMTMVRAGGSDDARWLVAAVDAL